MFTKRHEQELAEIKALTHELGERFQEILAELEEIKEAQARLAPRDRQGPAGKRKAGGSSTRAPDDEASESQVTGVKKARRHRASSAIVAPDAEVTAERQEKAPAKRASRPKQAKRRRAQEARAEDAPVADPGPVREARPIKRGANKSRRG